jgi:transposase
MPRQSPPLECSREDKVRLTTIRKSRTEEARIVERAKIVLARVAGKEIRQVARDLKVSVPTVTKWCKRFSLRGLKGLLDDPRPGKPPKYDTGFRDQVLNLLVQPPPQGMPAWEGRVLADKLGSSVDAVWRVLRREGVYLRRRRSWRAATDMGCVPKRADTIGLYLNPPLNAVILSASEMPDLQTIEQPSGYVETDSGAIARALKRTRRRHGALKLSAALETGTGQRRTKLTDHQRRVDFQNFLDAVIADQPPGGEIHVILDCDLMNREWLAALEARVEFHFTPTSAHWVSLVEIVFGVLASALFKGLDDKVGGRLRNAIEAFIRDHNEYAKPFRWRKGDTKGGVPGIH